MGTLIIPDLQMRTFKTQTFSLLFMVTQKDSHPVFWPQSDAWVGASVLVCPYVWLYLFTHMCMCDCMCVCTYAIHMCEWQSQDSSPDLSDVKDAFSYYIFKIKKKENSNWYFCLTLRSAEFSCVHCLNWIKQRYTTMSSIYRSKSLPGKWK